MATNIGLQVAVPFLFSVLALAVALFTARLATAVDEQALVRASPPRLVAPAPDAGAAPGAPRHPERSVMPRNAIARRGAAPTAQPADGGLEREVGELERALKEKRDEHAALDHERAVLADRLAGLEKLEARVARARLSRDELEARAKELHEAIAAAAAKIASVQREIPANDAVHARRLVPAGSRRAPVFVECDAKGAWLMPERARLQASVPPVDRETFLARARARGYVVFLIRPDGFVAFERYRAVVEAHNKTAATPLDYGFEPVNADWKLHYPTEESTR